MILKRFINWLLNRSEPIIEDWDVPTEVHVMGGGTITNLSDDDLTVKGFICLICGTTSHFKNQKCAKCDYHLF